MGEAGFDVPQTPTDKYTQQLYEKYGLPAGASLKDIEPVATKLLENPLGFLDGAALVLGRRVDAKEKDILATIMSSKMDAPTKFGALLLAKATEVVANKK